MMNVKLLLLLLLLLHIDELVVISIIVSIVVCLISIDIYTHTHSLIAKCNLIFNRSGRLELCCFFHSLEYYIVCTRIASNQMESTHPGSDILLLLQR